ncbi:MAG TPA: pyridoxamine 5'-phosphate oxidase [Acetobacteraceae bacterium]|nr:pyridoxamine 5'-phosphate oxidase [Acetobacteraceae bacterium]
MSERTDPFDWFLDWMTEAEAAEPNEPNAMTLATAAPDGQPAARIVLLKGIDPVGADPRGFVFYTNTESRKGGELATNPQAALLFHWKSLGRQIRVEGRVQPATLTEADAYFASRLRISRLGAWASDQSRPLSDRAQLENRLADYEARFPGDDIPRPAYWAGYRVVPDRFEFWQNMPYRLHDRTTFVHQPDGSWKPGKLFP